MYTDNPLRVAGPDELPSDNLSRSESMEDLEYDGSLIEDCASIVELGKALEAQRAEPMQPNIFKLARQRDRDERFAAAMALVTKTSRAMK
jgi:hypothetical protein